MKKSRLYVFVIIVIILISIIWYLQGDTSVTYDEQMQSHVFNEEGDKADTKEIKIDVKNVHKGELLLVNDEHGVEKSVKTDIRNLFENKEIMGDYGLLQTDIELSEEITTYFNEMIAGAKQDGVDHFLISSGFRSFEEQAELYEKMGADSALPAGYSEHQLGLALDVGSSEGSMAESKEGEWIAENAWEYGFILRYPQDKTDITGIKYEPWHIRYVGKPHSVIMHDKNFVLEEYLQFLREKKQMSIKVDDKSYDLFYYPVSEPMTISIPKYHNYTISGDNVGGVIITTYE